LHQEPANISGGQGCRAAEGTAQSFELQMGVQPDKFWGVEKSPPIMQTASSPLRNGIVYIFPTTNIIPTN
jgi:hypothetical protein